MNNKEMIESVQQQIGKVISGKELIILKIFTSIIAGGHVLLEDVPGVGKTTLAIAFSKIFNLTYKRMQFTPDVLPSDITGFTMYNKKSGEFEYKEGAAMCNVFLADEINRTSPKTQAALLEVMEEKRVTVDGVTRELLDPFFVIATQNPVGYVGTQKLPESQLDRFMIKLSMGYPDYQSEINMYKGVSYNAISDVQQIMSSKEIIALQEKCKQIFVEDSIYDYLTQLVQSTRTNENVSLGISPRGGLALISMAKATALLNDREYVVPEDIINNMGDVFNHRIVLSSKAKANGRKVADVIDSIKDQIDIPMGR